MNPNQLETAPRGPVFLAALRAALGRVPVWLLVSFVLALLALPAFVATRGAFADALGHAYAPGSQLRELSTNFVIDHADERAALDAGLASWTAVAGFFAVLLGVFSAGGWLQVFLQRTAGRSVRRFLSGGARWFWRFFRVFLLVGVWAALLHWTLYEEPWHELVETRLLELPEVPSQGDSVGSDYSEERLAEFGDELTARRVVWIQDGLHALLFALLLCWGVYTRTRMALQDGRSAVWAGLCTFFTMLRHPLRTLRPMLLLLVVEASIVLAAGSVHEWLESNGLADEASATSVWMVLALSLLVTIASEIVHAARYSAAILVSKEVVAPISRPDPWKDSVGAPGAPQYPILDDDDGYEVRI